ncbi:unnamed protein product, partial [Porites lobata]
MFQKQDDIEKTIKILEEQTANIDATDCQNVWSELEKKRRELETIIEYQTKGAILRSKSRWYNEGEKNTKYFLNLEKRHCKQGTITQLEVNDKALIQSHREILHECETFNKNLYSSKVQVNDYPEVFFPPTREVLSEERKQHCEGLLSSKECLEALNEILAEAIRNKKEIKGIKIYNSEVKVSQYADDTTLILDGTEESVRASLLLIEAFGNISGLRLNNENTEALWI